MAELYTASVFAWDVSHTKARNTKAAGEAIYILEGDDKPNSRECVLVKRGDVPALIEWLQSWLEETEIQASRSRIRS